MTSQNLIYILAGVGILYLLIFFGLMRIKFFSKARQNFFSYYRKPIDEVARGSITGTIKTFLIWRAIKVIIYIILIAILIGGFFAWQYFAVPEEALPQSLEEEALPRFEDFPVQEQFEGTPSAVDYSNPNAQKFYTRITEGARQAPNFAGHYTIIEWGCGSNCQTGVVFDAEIGKIYNLPMSEYSKKYQANSSLLITNSETGEINKEYLASMGATIFYYNWENNNFELLHEEKYASAQALKDETADWKTHRNKTYEYEIKYPDNYTISMQLGSNIANDIISFKPPAKIIFLVEDNPGNLTLSEWVKSDLVIHDLSIKWQPITVGNIASLKSPISGNMDWGIGYTVLIPQKNKIYQLMFSTEAPNTEAGLKIFDQMLSTFRFWPPR